MNNQTPNLAMPYILPEQSQKHISVNEGLSLLDSLVQMSVEDVDVNTPPSTKISGYGYILGAQPTGDWVGHANQMAFYQYNAWVFISPKEGWIVWNKTESKIIIYKQSIWENLIPHVSCNTLPDGMTMIKTEIDHTITVGSFNETSLVIPAHSVVLSITGRVLTEINGDIHWDLGVLGYQNRYGSMIGYQQHSTVIGLTSHPLTYYVNTNVRISATSGSFTMGEIRLCLYTYTFDTP